MGLGIASKISRGHFGPAFFVPWGHPLKFRGDLLKKGLRAKLVLSNFLETEVPLWLLMILSRLLLICLLTP